MRISAKADYAVRAAVEMAAAGDEPVKGEKLAEAQDIPLQFLEHILLELKHAAPGAGAAWGARRLLAGPAARGDHARERDPSGRGTAREHPGPGPRADQVRGQRGATSEVWIAVRASLRRVLENVTIADLRDGKIPSDVLELTQDEGAWVTR